MHFIANWIICSVVVLAILFGLVRIGAWDRFEETLLDFAESIDDDLDRVAQGYAPSARFQIATGIAALCIGFIVALHF